MVHLLQILTLFPSQLSNMKSPLPDSHSLSLVHLWRRSSPPPKLVRCCRRSSPLAQACLPSFFNAESRSAGEGARLSLENSHSHDSLSKIQVVRRSLPLHLSVHFPDIQIYRSVRVACSIFRSVARPFVSPLRATKGTLDAQIRSDAKGVVLFFKTFVIFYIYYHMCTSLFDINLL